MMKYSTDFMGRKIAGGFKHVFFSPRIPGERMQFDEHIFFKWIETQLPTSYGSLCHPIDPK